MILSAHQLNFLPGSRFWYKAAKSDIMDLRYKAQYTENPGYVRRVKMRDTWCTVPVQKGSSNKPMNEVRYNVAEFRERFPKIMHGRYSGARHYKTRGLELVEFATTRDTEMLWELNLELLLWMRDQLGITTPFGLGQHTTKPKVEGMLDYLSVYKGVDALLSGTGAANYMEDTTPFDQAGIKVIWSNHDPITDDSAVSLLMDYNNPLELVLREKE
jgi:WbqC-like protein family